jgi:TolA-binding protein
MKTINHDGEEYVLKSEIESAFKERISKLSSRAIQAEEAANQLQEQIDNQSGELQKISKLQEHISTLESSLQDAESRFSRVSMLSELGFTDPEIREAVEWSYERAMKGQEERVPMGDWIKGIKENPDTAPAVLKPHLQSQAAPEASPEASPEAAPVVAQAAPEAPLLPPKTNTAAKPAPVQSGNIIERGLTDLQFYEQNREAIVAAYRSSRRV